MMTLVSPQVSSFVIDNPEFDEVSKTSEKFLTRKTSLPEDSDHLDRTVDPETQARLEALLEAAGKIQVYFSFTLIVVMKRIHWTGKLIVVQDTSLGSLNHVIYCVLFIHLMR
jgi:dethiobiotin synthetase